MEWKKKYIIFWVTHLCVCVALFVSSLKVDENLKKFLVKLLCVDRGVTIFFNLKPGKDV